MTDAAFADVPASAMPIIMSAFRVEDDVLVWQETVREPSVVTVPPLARSYGPVWVLIEMDDGVILEHHP